MAIQQEYNQVKFSDGRVAIQVVSLSTGRLTGFEKSKALGWLDHGNPYDIIGDFEIIPFSVAAKRELISRLLHDDFGSRIVSETADSLVVEFNP